MEISRCKGLRSPIGTNEIIKACGVSLHGLAIMLHLSQIELLLGLSLRSIVIDYSVSTESTHWS